MTRGAEATGKAIKDAVAAVTKSYRAVGLARCQAHEWQAAAEAMSVYVGEDERAGYVESFVIAAKAAVEGLADLN